MKKVFLSLSLIASGALMAGSWKSVHDLMDNRLKGQSNSGTLDDSAASEDGLGIVALNGAGGPSAEVTADLETQKAIRDILKSETNKENRKNIRESILADRISAKVKSSDKYAKNLSRLKNVGMDFEYQAGTIDSCKNIKKAFPLSASGEYKLLDGFIAKCDMSGVQGAEVYNNNLSSCAAIESRFDIKIGGEFTLANGFVAYCDTKGNELYNNNLSSCQEIEDRFDITTLSSYKLADGSTVQCNPDGTKYVAPVSTWTRFMNTQSGNFAEQLPIIADASAQAGTIGVSSTALSKTTSEFKIVSPYGTIYYKFSSPTTIIELFRGNGRTVTITNPNGTVATGTWAYSRNSTRYTSGSRFSSDDGIFAYNVSNGFSIIGNGGGTSGGSYFGNYNGGDSGSPSIQVYYK